MIKARTLSIFLLSIAKNIAGGKFGSTFVFNSSFGSAPFRIRRSMRSASLEIAARDNN